MKRPSAPFIVVIPVYELFPESVQVPDPVLVMAVRFDEAKFAIFPANSPVPDELPERTSVLEKFPERARSLVNLSEPVPDWLRVCKGLFPVAFELMILSVVTPDPV
jgi:hypothetical protein